MDDLQFHELVGEQPERPLRMSGRRLAAGKRDEPGLLFPVKQAGTMEAVCGPPGQRGLYRMLDAVTLHAIDSAAVDVKLRRTEENL